MQDGIPTPINVKDIQPEDSTRYSTSTAGVFPKRCREGKKVRSFRIQVREFDSAIAINVARGIADISSIGRYAKRLAI